jgi:hypothetical protein
MLYCLGDMIDRALLTRLWVRASVCGLVVFGAASAGAVTARSAAPYRPPPIQPVISPSLSGEGVWRSAGTPVHGAPPLLVTTFRPDARAPSVVAYVAWIDQTRTQLALYPGSNQPLVAVPRGPAKIPPAQRWRLLATFNGGFKYGPHWGRGGGFAVNGHTYVAMRPGLGTLVGYVNGAVDVAAWSGGATVGPNVAFARQNLPLLVNDRHPGSDLANMAIWGATIQHAQSVLRTGIGIDSQGNLIYAAANETTAGLAAILIRAGAVRAIELDINYTYPTFNLYTHTHGLTPHQFLPNNQQLATRFLTPDSRDFFAVYRPILGQSANVPFH